MVLFSNSTASFTVGLTISGAVHFALAEVGYLFLMSYLLLTGNRNYDCFPVSRDNSPDRRLHAANEKQNESIPSAIGKFALLLNVLCRLNIGPVDRQQSRSKC